jgi:hydrogenase-4 component B
MTAPTLLYLLNGITLSLVAGVPLLLVVCCLILTTRERAYRLLPWAPVPALLTALFIPGDVVVHVPWFFLGSSMGLDSTGRIFLTLTACVWLLASLSALEKLRTDPSRFRFAAYFLASMAGNLGLVLAQDILGYYLFFAIMSFSAYGLIVHNRTAAAHKAGRVYLVLVIVSELAMFGALILLSGSGQALSVGNISAGAFSMAVVVLLFMAFGVKIGALPFQAWMVLAYQQAPLPAATALAGAMVNAGILGWLRLFPFGRLVLPDGALFFILIGTLATVYGVLYGIVQNRIGRVLACSSISQMGLVTIIAGFGLLSFETGRYAVTLLTLYAVHHSLAKTSLFLGYDFVDRGERIPGPLLLAGLLLPCLALAGFPLTGGAIVKTGLKELAMTGGATWHLFSSVFLPVSSAGTTVLMLHCTRLLWQHRHPAQTGSNTIVLSVWLLSVAGVAAVLWLWPEVRSLGRHTLQPGAMLQSLWPVTLGAVLALGWFRTGPRLSARGRSLPDFDALAQKLFDTSMTALAAITDIVDRARRIVDAEPVRRCCSLSPTSTLSGRLVTAEKVLSRWSVVGLFYLVICICILLLMG